MKIWTITTDQDGEGTATAVHLTEGEARAQYARIIAAAWESWFGHNAAPMPDDTAKAWAILTDQTGYMDTVTLTEHDISDHPATREAIATLHLMLHRLEVNDMEGEEAPFMEDCETAIAMLSA